MTAGERTSILIIYTGGTIGMINDPQTGSLAPFDFEHIMGQVPELAKFGYHLKSITFDVVYDSSNINPDVWINLATIIGENYDQFDGFVVLHGTDTMAYTASALSFLLENLHKPVVFTGAQLPIGTLRTDGKENFISAIEIAAAMKNGHPVVPEVCIFFENKLFRGNRTSKHSADYFDAFRSYNYPELAKAGVNITYNYSAIRYPLIKKELIVHKKLENRIAILKIFPGITSEVVNSIVKIKGLKGLILESFGSGNAPSQKWFIEAMKEAVEMGIIVLNVTQCCVGTVDMGAYQTSIGLMEVGIISGNDSTTEAAVTKLMFLLGQNLSKQEIQLQIGLSLCGEINV